MPATLRKHASIWKFLGELAQHIDSEQYQVIDYWESDLYAVGVAPPDDPAQLVYVSTFGQSPGTFAYECEVAAERVPFSTTRRGIANGMNELAIVIRKHLGLAAVPGRK
jgi:hypothetical protein